MSDVKASELEEPEQEELEVVEEEGQQLPTIDFRYNDRSQKEYRKYKFKVPDELQKYERRFLEDVDLRNGPIKREVYKVIRCRAQDESGKMQDYLYYLERWNAKDYLGNDLPTVPDHVEGRYEEIRVKYAVDDKGRPKKSEPKIGNKITRYYIPFNKSTLDRILKGVEKDSIEYVVKIGDPIRGETRRDNSFSYHQFANCTYTELITLSYQPGGPRKTPNFPTAVKK